MRNFAFSVARNKDAPFEARCLLGERLDGQTTEATSELARLLVSELVTNCVRHAPGDPIGVNGSLCGEQLRVEVRSVGPSFDTATALPAASNADGRGLYLVDTLSDAWGSRTTGDVTGVWFEVGPEAAAAF